MKKFKEIMKDVGIIILWIAVIFIVLTMIISCDVDGDERAVADEICEYLGFEQYEILNDRNNLLSGDEKIMCYNDDGETLIVDLQKE